MNNNLSLFYEEKSQYFSNSFDSGFFVAEGKSKDFYYGYEAPQPSQEKIKLDIKNDLVFKAVYSVNRPESKAALIALLNSILDRKDDPIVDITYLNPISVNERINVKIIVMDIKVQTASNELIDIEMQTHSYKDYPERTIMYCGKMIAESLNQGLEYGKMKKIIVISIVFGKVFKENEDIHSIYKLLNIKTHTVMSDILEFHYMELGNLNIEERDVTDLSEEERLAAYFKYSADESKADFMQELLEVKIQRG